jgi:hypothetical protein
MCDTVICADRAAVFLYEIENIDTTPDGKGQLAAASSRPDGLNATDPGNDWPTVNGEPDTCLSAPAELTEKTDTEPS